MRKQLLLRYHWDSLANRYYRREPSPFAPGMPGTLTENGILVCRELSAKVESARAELDLFAGKYYQAETAFRRLGWFDAHGLRGRAVVGVVGVRIR